MPGQGLSKQETQKQEAPTKSGMTGLAYLHSMGGMAPGGGGGTPPPGKGDPPDDKGDDGSDEEENEEDDTDEETVSVTSSSQVSAGRVRPPKWNDGRENTKEVVGGSPEDPNDPSRGGSASVDSYKCLWAFIECFKRFFGLQSSLGITNVNRSHNKPLELIETI